MTTPHASQPAQPAPMAGAARVLPQLQGVWRGDSRRCSSASSLRAMRCWMRNCRAGLAAGRDGRAAATRPWPCRVAAAAAGPGGPDAAQRGPGGAGGAALQAFAPGLEAAGVAAHRLCCVEADTHPAPTPAPTRQAMGQGWPGSVSRHCAAATCWPCWPGCRPVCPWPRCAGCNGRPLRRGAFCGCGARPRPPCRRWPRPRRCGCAWRPSWGCRAKAVRQPACACSCSKRRGPALEHPLKLPLHHWAWQDVLQAQALRRTRQAGEAQRWLHGHGQLLPAEAPALQAAAHTGMRCHGTAEPSTALDCLAAACRAGRWPGQRRQ